MRLALALAVFAALWLVLSGADLLSWAVGVPVVLLATWVHVALNPRLHWSAVGHGRRLWLLPSFAWFFLIESLRSAWDIARRVLAFRPGLAPGVIEYRCGLPTAADITLFAGITNLLPGTLVVDVRGRRLQVHCMDTTQDIRGSLRNLELRLRPLVGEPAQ